LSYKLVKSEKLLVFNAAERGFTAGDARTVCFINKRLLLELSYTVQ